MSVAVCVPSIPPRRDMLTRAISSALRQSRPPDELHVAVDLDHEGATVTRNRAWRASGTDWVAFLDDDDEFHFDHLEACLAHADLTDADFVYPGYEVVGGVDPRPQVFGVPWDPSAPVQTTITVLVRRQVLHQVGGFREPGDEVDEDGYRSGEDFDVVRRVNDHGFKVSHLPQRTWTWHHHMSNTSGLPDRW